MEKKKKKERESRTKKEIDRGKNGGRTKGRRNEEKEREGVKY